MPVANPLGEVTRRASIAHVWTFLTTLTLSLVAIGALSVLREQTMEVPAIRTGYQLCFLLALIIVSLSHLRSELVPFVSGTFVLLDGEETCVELIACRYDLESALRPRG